MLQIKILWKENYEPVKSGLHVYGLEFSDMKNIKRFVEKNIICWKIGLSKFWVNNTLN